MNRREFAQKTAMASTALLLRPALGAQDAAHVPQEAKELYKRALVLDCNLEPVEHRRLPLAQSELDMIRNSGVTVVKWTLGGINADFAGAAAEIAFVQQMIELHPTYFLQVRVSADMERARREAKMGIIFSFESAEMLNGKAENIELFRRLGVRVMQLSYNRKSPFGAGVMEPDGGGLTPLGHEAVQKMNSIGVALDISHANRQTTSEAMAASIRPVLMTHAGCASVHPHPRNKTDDQLRALAAKGGVIGIYDLPYLAAPPKQPDIDDYMAHMIHALKMVGEDHVGVGSDVSVAPFDTSAKAMVEFRKSVEDRQKAGLSAPEEGRPTYVVGLNTPGKIEVIAEQLLKRGYPARVAEKVIGGNFARVLTEIWK
jgi:membrane dipeptidase